MEEDILNYLPTGMFRETLCMPLQPELKTLEWDILKHDRLILLSNEYTFAFHFFL